MDRWEYKTVTVESDDGREHNNNIMTELNGSGAKGWEVVNITTQVIQKTQISQPKPVTAILYKRKKAAPCQGACESSK